MKTVAAAVMAGPALAGLRPFRIRIGRPQWLRQFLSPTGLQASLHQLAPVSSEQPVPQQIDLPAGMAAVFT